MLFPYHLNHKRRSTKGCHSIFLGYVVRKMHRTHPVTTCHPSQEGNFFTITSSYPSHLPVSKGFFISSFCFLCVFVVKKNVDIHNLATTRKVGSARKPTFFFILFACHEKHDPFPFLHLVQPCPDAYHSFSYQ